MALRRSCGRLLRSALPQLELRDQEEPLFPGLGGGGCVDQEEGRSLFRATLVYMKATEAVRVALGLGRLGGRGHGEGAQDDADAAADDDDLSLFSAPIPCGSLSGGSRRLSSASASASSTFAGLPASIPRSWLRKGEGGREGHELHDDFSPLPRSNTASTCFANACGCWFWRGMGKRSSCCGQCLLATLPQFIRIPRGLRGRGSVKIDELLGCIGAHPKGPWSRVIIIIMVLGSISTGVKEIHSGLLLLTDKGKRCFSLANKRLRSTQFEYSRRLLQHVIDDEAGWE